MLASSRLFALVLLLALSGCGPAAQVGLAPGLSARMDQAGARLDAGAALGLINAYRSTRGVGPLAIDAQLANSATALAAAYARSGTAPKTPPGASAMRVSAGYPNIADTFSGWRNSPADADVLARAAARRAGIAAVSDPASTYGIYWVLLLAD